MIPHELQHSALERVHLIRHAESTANVQGLVCGCLDFELTEMGRNHARMNSKREAFKKLAGLPTVTSNLRRAMETAHLLGLSVTRSLEGLKETDTGASSWLTQTELCKISPQFTHHSTDLDSRYAEGETTREMLERSWASFVKVAAELNSPEIVVVSHGGPLNSISSHLLEIDFRGFPKFAFKNTALTTLSRINSEATVWRLETMNAQ